MLSNKIKEYRKKENISQENLAKELGVSRQTIISLEKGRYKPSIELAFTISKRFNCLIEDIFIWENDKNDQKKC